GLDDARAVRMARQVLHVRSRVHLAATAAAASSTDRPARGQRRGTEPRRTAARPDRRGVSLERPRAGRVRSLSAVRERLRLDADAGRLPPAPPHLRRRNEREGARGGGAAPRLFLGGAAQLPPWLDRKSVGK